MGVGAYILAYILMVVNFQTDTAGSSSGCCGYSGRLESGKLILIPPVPWNLVVDLGPVFLSKKWQFCRPTPPIEAPPLSWMCPQIQKFPYLPLATLA